jgi:cytochrome b561
MVQNTASVIPMYSRAARRFHWWVAFLVLLQAPIGFYMVYRRKEMPSVNEAGETVAGVWDSVTSLLYSSHKTIGLLIFLSVLLRLGYRLSRGAPPSDPSVPPVLTALSHLVHWGLYLMLVLVPIGGYIAISYGRHLQVFGLPLPPVTIEDKKFSEGLFEFHEFGATILLALVGLHIAAAAYHRFVRKDRVVERMLPQRRV